MGEASKKQWYALALALKKAPSSAIDAVGDALGKPLSRSRRSTLGKLATIHPRLGHLLDELGAPWRVVRFVVHGGGAAAQRERARTSLAEWVARQEAAGKVSRLERALLEVLDEPELGQEPRRAA